MKAPGVAFLVLLCLVAMPLGAQVAPTDPGVAVNVRGETINKRPSWNDVVPLNQLPTLDKLTRVPEISATSLQGEARARNAAAGRPATGTAISIGENRAPGLTEREMIRRAGQDQVSLGDLARELKRQREAQKAVAPNRKRWVLEKQ